MGASAVGARLAIAVLGDRARRPIVVADGYGVPPWTTAADIVLCCSYSGATEETPACYEDARNRGATLVVATTGGRLGERARCDGVPVIAGEGLTAPVAYRWKCQLNENAKVAAFWSVLPEADHNEVCGWGGCGEVGPFAGVFLEDPAGHARVARRTALTAALARADGVVVERVRARGDNCADRVLSLVLLGDLVSVYLAVLRGADPGDISAIDRLKASLS